MDLSSEGEHFAQDLTGLSKTSSRKFRIIEGTREVRTPARMVSQKELKALAEFNLNSFQNVANNIQSALDEIDVLAEKIGWDKPIIKDHNTLRNWLFEKLTGFEPLKL